MANFERHGEWSINREVFEQIVADRAWQGLQGLVDDGVVTQFVARRKHRDFLKSDGYQQAVNAAISQSLDVLERLDQVAVKPYASVTTHTY